jgi:hypothetical protein
MVLPQSHKHVQTELCLFFLLDNFCTVRCPIFLPIKLVGVFPNLVLILYFLRSLYIALLLKPYSFAIILQLFKFIKYSLYKIFFGIASITFSILICFVGPFCKSYFLIYKDILLFFRFSILDILSIVYFLL